MLTMYGYNGYNGYVVFQAQSFHAHPSVRNALTRDPLSLCEFEFR